MKMIVEFESAQEIQDFLDFMLLKDAIKQKSNHGKTKLHELGLTARTQNILLSSGYEFVEDAFSASDFDLLRLDNFGRKALRELREIQGAWEAKKNAA